MDSAYPLFWTESYWRALPEQQTFRAVETEAGGFRLFLQMIDQRAKVPGLATFGGWYGNVVDNPVPNFIALYQALIWELRALHVEISLPPSYFLPNLFEPQQVALASLGAEIVLNINSTIDLRPSHTSPAFSRGNVKRVRQFSEIGGAIRESETRELPAAYQLLKDNRARRGATLSMSEERFRTLASDGQGLYRCWLAVSGDTLLGAAFTVEISREVLYVLYWGDTLEGRKVSVVASLCDYLASHASDQGKSFLDLGVSSIRGSLDTGLARFKDNLGATRFHQPLVVLKAGETALHAKDYAGRTSHKTLTVTEL